MSAADDQQPCPCERVVHPRPLGNPPGRQALTRRVGDFCSFRRALLTGRSGETALAEWRPGADGDLAVQLVEWWAYIADVLTFYDERIANESYLRTARLPESVRRLVGLLGYRPRPAIAAQGLLAGLLAEERPVTLPRGFAVQSKPGPGQQPQIFELGEATTLEPPAAIDADPPADGELAGRSDLLLEGTVTSVKPGDLLLLRSPGWSGTTGWAALRVEALQPEKDPRSRPRTRLSFALEGGSLAGADVASCRLLRPAQAAQPWPYHSGEGVSSNCTHFASLVRSLHVGDELLFEWPADSEEQTSNVVLAQVTKYYEKVWYANGPNPGTAPADPTPAIAILHSYVYYTSKDKKNTGKKSLKNAENTQSFKRRNEDDLEINDKISVIDTSSLSSAPEDQLTIHHGFVEVARLCAEPALTLTPQTTTLHAAGSVRFPPGPNRAVLVEDATGAGVAACLDSVAEDGATAQLRWAEGASFELQAPLCVLCGLLAVSRGKSVAGEVLGSGDPAVAGQELVLQKSPLTYLASSDPHDPGYRSTLCVRVDGIPWQEAQSFYGQAPEARIYVLYEDDEQRTHVRFGDGLHGARLPAGRGNVVADYRFGGGAAAPGAGTLTNVLAPRPGLRGLRNPLAPGGGADAEPAAQLRSCGPRSVLTFDRAVSLDDYEALAAQAPGVTRARACFSWDEAGRAARVKVYVGDDDAAVESARGWLRSYSDLSRPPRVVAALPLEPTLKLTVLAAPGYDPETVAAAVRSALLDGECGLFSPARRGVGVPLFESEIHEACLSQPGAVAVHGLDFDDGSGGAGQEQEPGGTDASGATSRRHDPGEGGFFVLLEANLTVCAEASAHG